MLWLDLLLFALSILILGLVMLLVAGLIRLLKKRP